MEYIVLLWGLLPDVGGWFESLSTWQIVTLAAAMLGAVLLATRFN